MDMLQQAFDLVNDAGNRLGNAALKAITNDLNAGVTNTISSSAQKMGITENMQNYSFSDRRSYNAFVQEMNAQGVPVVALGSKVGDSFVAAIPESNISAATSFRSTYGAGSISNYRPIQVEEYSRSSPINNLGGQAANGITKHIDGLYEIQQMTGFIKNNLRGLHTVFTKYQGGDINGDSHLLSGNNVNGAFKRVTVVEDVCYVDGLRCHDKQICAAALAQARQAEQEAYLAIAKGASHENYSEAMQMASTYKRDVIVNDASLLQTEKAWGQNSLDRVLSEVNMAQNLAQQSTDIDVNSCSQSDLAAVGVNATNGQVSLTFEQRQQVLDSINKFEASLYSLNEAEKNLAAQLAAGQMAAIQGQEALLNSMLQKLQGNSLSAQQQSYIANALKDQQDILANQQKLAAIQAQLSKTTTNANALLALQQQEAALKAQIAQQENNIRAAMQTAVDIDRANQIRLTNLRDTFGLGGLNVSLADNLKKDINCLSGVTGDFTRENLVDANVEFAEKCLANNINILKRNGEIDLDVLASLKGSDIGVSEETLAFFRRLNVNEFGAGGFKHFLGKSGQKIGYAMQIANMSGDRDLAELSGYVNKAQKTVKYSQDSLRAMNRMRKRLRTRAQIRRLNKAPKIKQSTAKLKTASSKAAANQKKLDLFKSKQTKDLTKLNRRPHHLFRRAEKAKQEALRALGQTKLGRLFGLGGKLMRNLNAVMIKAKKFAIKLAFSGFGLIIKGCVAVSAFLCVYMLISSLADAYNSLRLEHFNKYAPADFSETVAYQLYDILKSEEDSWLNHLGNYDGALKHYKEIRYGEYGEDYRTYIKNVKGLYNSEASAGSDGSIASMDGLYINPFFLPSGKPVMLTDYEKDRSSSVGKGAAEATEAIEYMTKVTTYDGINTMNIGTNDNKYTERDGTSYGGYIPNIETGHTSNIKDILSMTDIMYAMEMQTFFEDVGNEGAASDIFGTAPQQWDIAHDESDIGWFGWAWRKLFKVTDKSWKDFKATHNEYSATTFNTVKGYAENLFNQSHSEQWYLDVDFFEPDFIRT